MVYTIRSVVDEIRCTTTKARLRVLPYEIKMVEPSLESIHFGNYLLHLISKQSRLSAHIIRLTYSYRILQENGRLRKSLSDRHPSYGPYIPTGS